MDGLLISYGFLMSLVISLLIVLSKPLHSHLSSDTLKGVQKVHQGIIPRIGGVAIFVSLAVAWFFFFQDLTFGQILMASLPVFLTGLWEDIFKSVSSLRRLVAALISGGLFVYLSGYTLSSTDIYLFDVVFEALHLFPILTIISIAAFANAINIMDGFNGLASGSSAIMALSIAYLGYQSADMLVMQLALWFAAVVWGFYVVNFPRGSLFLGDSGAYLNGFMLSVLGIMLVDRNIDISPLILLVIFGYPIIELLFSIYRKALRKGHSPDKPDKVHFHMLVYRSYGRRWARTTLYQNSLTGGLMLLFSASGLLTVIAFPITRAVALLYFFTITFVYLYLYKKMSLN